MVPHLPPKQFRLFPSKKKEKENNSDFRIRWPSSDSGDLVNGFRSSSTSSLAISEKNISASDETGPLPPTHFVIRNTFTCAQTRPNPPPAVPVENTTVPNSVATGGRRDKMVGPRRRQRLRAAELIGWHAHGAHRP